MATTPYQMRGSACGAALHTRVIAHVRESRVRMGSQKPARKGLRTRVYTFVNPCLRGL
jgi:hypothetical protein